MENTLPVRYRPYGGVHTDAVICNECSTRSVVVALYIREMAEHDADAHTPVIPDAV